MNFSTFSKIAVISFLGISLSNIAYAVDFKGCHEEVRCVPQLRDGFYVGGQVGYDSYRIRQSLNAPGSFSIVTASTGWVGGLFVGYGQYCNNFYLGAEILGNYSGADQRIISISSDDGDTAQQKMKIKETFGVSIIPGVKIYDNVLGYLRGGYYWTKFEVTNSARDIDDGVVFSATESSSSRRGGWAFGLGLQTVVWCNLDVRTEYNHVWYRSGNFNTFGVSNKFNASDNQFMVGLLYHIA